MLKYDLTRYYHGERPEMLGYVPRTTKRVLEIGCGEGHFSEALAKELKCETWGIEINPTSAQEARKRLQHVFTGDLFEQLAHVPRGSFDCVVMNDVLEHLPDSSCALKAIRDVLAPQGSLVLSVPNVRHFATMFRYVVKGDWNYEDAGVLDRTHLRFFTVKSLQRTLEENGFKVVKLKPLNEDRALKVKIFQWLSFGLLRDVSYLQIAAHAVRAD